nr:uncharacterized protein LOC109190505 [Ipomoea batatas]
MRSEVGASVFRLRVIKEIQTGLGLSTVCLSVRFEGSGGCDSWYEVPERRKPTAILGSLGQNRSEGVGHLRLAGEPAFKPTKVAQCTEWSGTKRRRVLQALCTSTLCLQSLHTIPSPSGLLVDSFTRSASRQRPALRLSSDYWPLSALSRQRFVVGGRFPSSTRPESGSRIFERLELRCTMALRQLCGFSDGEVMRSDCKPCSRLMRQTAAVFSVGGALGFWVLCRLHYGKQVMAIYQSGGEFKTDKDALPLYKGGDACSILLMLWKLATK